MSARACDREDELLDCLERGFVPAELESHAAECRACGELLLVAGALLDDRRAAVAEAPVPSAGSMLWRMRMRRQREAEAAARRSLLIGQIATLVIAIALVGSFFGVDIAAGAKHLIAAIRVSTPLLIAIGFSAVAAPLAGWAAIRQK